MSQEERDRLHWLKLARDKKITQKMAAKRMEVSARWVRQLLRKLKQKGDRAVVHGLRKRPSNRKIGEAVRQRAIELVGLSIRVASPNGKRRVPRLRSDAGVGVPERELRD